MREWLVIEDSRDYKYTWDAALKHARPEEERATRWMVATLTERGYLIEGHPYVSQKSAQQDANLILARGERAEVWACTRCEPQREERQ